MKQNHTIKCSLAKNNNTEILNQLKSLMKDNHIKEAEKSDLVIGDIMEVYLCIQEEHPPVITIEDKSELSLFIKDLELHGVPEQVKDMRDCIKIVINEKYTIQEKNGTTFLITK